jgi:hypothetical protein
MTHIIHPTADGVAITTPTGEVPIEQVAQQVAPDGIYAIVTADQIPSDRTFRAAWVYSPDGIEIDLNRAKAIGHDLRRANRNAEFAPHDKVISLQIPGVQRDAAEAARAAIRARYVIIESAIDAATTTDEIKEALSA